MNIIPIRPATGISAPLQLCLLLGLATGASAQQGFDPQFDAKVVKPAYTNTHPRVLVDAAHFNVHTMQSGYKPFADLITSDGCLVAANDKPFAMDSLKGSDILVIANARAMASPSEKPAFTDAECDAVEAWVKAGGRLLFVTDHYPTGHAAELLAKRFGASMSRGTTIDPDHSDRAAGGPSTLVYSLENKLLGEHAITKGRDESERIKKVITFTGQSLKGPEGSVSFLKLGDSAKDRLPGENNREVPAAGRAQGLAFTYGKGRVVMLGEASEISAQLAGPQGRKMGMNYPGIDNRQMALNIIHWLSGLLE